MNTDAETWISTFVRSHDDAFEDDLRKAMQWTYADAATTANDNKMPLTDEFSKGFAAGQLAAQLAIEERAK